MKALVYTAPGVVEIRDADEPVPGPDDAIVTVAAAGICGSEIHGIRTPGFRVSPLIMGHEFAGTLAGGTRVAVNPLRACGACDLCAAGHTEACRRRAIIGVHRPGGFAQRVAVPAAALHELPDDTPWTAAVIAEPVANAVHALHLAGADRATRVAILGCGAIGLTCLQTARAHGTARIAVADPTPARRKTALALGATTATEALDGEYDITIDAVGIPATRRQAIARLKPTGTAVWLGLAAAEPGFDATDLVRSEKRIIGSFAYTDDEYSLALTLAAGFDTNWITSYPLDRGPEVFATLSEAHPHPVKAVLTP